MPQQAALTAYKEAINQALERFLDAVPPMLGLAPESLSPQSLDAVAKLREYTLRPGKRIRGALAAAVYDDIKHTKLAAAGIALAVAQELVQSYLLIVDDVTDKSDTRRSKPTVHREYAVEQDQYGDEHEANMLALYVGLVTGHLANLALTAAPESPEHSALTLRQLHANLAVTGFGQIDDVSHKIGRRVTHDDIIRMYSLKTGYYTFVNPLQTGLLLAGVTDQQALHSVEAFGRAAGIAFQIHDDYLGVFGEVELTGKANVDDLQEGKYTLLVQYALDRASAEDQMRLRKILASGRVGQDDLAAAREIFNRSGATLDVQRETLDYARIAKERLGEIHVWSPAFRAFLTDLVTYSITRKT